MLQNQAVQPGVSGNYRSFLSAKVQSCIHLSRRPGINFFVNYQSGPKSILLLNCSQVPFTPIETIKTGMESISGISYIPHLRLIALRDHTPGLVKAISCDTGDTVWELRGKEQGLEIDPCGMIYSPHHQALLVADGANCRILVVTPGYGVVRQVVELSPGVGAVWELCLHNEQIVVFHLHGGKVKVSFLSLAAEKERQNVLPSFQIVPGTERGSKCEVKRARDVSAPLFSMARKEETLKCHSCYIIESYNDK